MAVSIRTGLGAAARKAPTRFIAPQPRPPQRMVEFTAQLPELFQRSSHFVGGGEHPTEPPHFRHTDEPRWSFDRNGPLMAYRGGDDRGGGGGGGRNRGEGGGGRAPREDVVELIRKLIKACAEGLFWDVTANQMFGKSVLTPPSNDHGANIAGTICAGLGTSVAGNTSGDAPGNKQIQIFELANRAMSDSLFLQRLEAAEAALPQVSYSSPSNTIE